MAIKAARESCVVKEQFDILILVMVTQIYAYGKIVEYCIHAHK